jgi:hypothetical protein
LWELRVRTATWTQLHDGRAPPLRLGAGGAATLASSSLVPCARTGAALVAQPRHDRLLLFGGCDAAQQHNDLYEFVLPSRDGGSGGERGAPSERRPSSSRTRQHGHDGRSGGGSSRGAQGEASEKARGPNGGGWAPVEMAGVPPPPRSNHALVAHPDGRVLVFGGFDGHAFLGDLTAAVLDGS